MSKQSNTIERLLESSIFASRWILAPFFIGLIIAMLVLLLKFGKELVSLLMGVLGLNDHDAIISILTLVDTALIAVLLLIIVFSGYENFVSKLSIGEHEDRPAWGWAKSVSRPQDEADQRHRGHLGGGTPQGIPREYHAHRRTDWLEDCHSLDLCSLRLAVRSLGLDQRPSQERVSQI